MARMKNYLIFLEENGYVEWNDSTEEYDHLVPDIYAPYIMEQYQNDTYTPPTEDTTNV